MSQIDRNKIGGRESEDGLGADREQLLMRYFDGECGAWDRMRVRTLLCRSILANEFLENLQKCSRISCEILNEPLADRRTSGEQVWQRVSARIDQELHTELLLGRRTSTKIDSANERAGVLEYLFGRAGWSFVGAAATAVVAIVWLQAGQNGPNGDSGVGNVALQQSQVLAPRSQTEQTKAMQLASANTSALDESGRRYGRPHVLESDVPSSVEVDWMRGGGRVRMIPNEQQSPTLWINRSNRSVVVGRKVGRANQPKFSDSSLQSELFDIERSTLEEPVGGYFSGR